MTRGTGKSKKICCWFLTAILLTGQSGQTAYAEEITVNGGMEGSVSELSADSGIAAAAYLDLPPLKGNTEFDAEGFHWQVIETGTDSSNDSLRCMGLSAGTHVDGGKLVIPDKIVYADFEYRVFHIAAGAFADCMELTELEIAEGRPTNSSSHNTMSIGSQNGSDPGAFAGCINLKKVTLPNTVTAIYSSTFRNCTALESVTFAKPAGYGHGGIESIGGWSFAGCSALRDVSFENISGEKFITRSIGNYAFQSCTGLEHIELPDTIEYVGDEAFRDCSSLKKIKLPEKTKDLRTYVFKDCSSLTEAEMSDQTAITGSNVFDGCSVLQTLKIDTTAPAAGTVWATVNVDRAASMGVLPTDRKVVFLNSGGTAYLTGSLLADAQTAYRAASDGNTTDDYWYGWEISKVEMYPIELTVKKDGKLWTDSGKSFELSANGTDFISYAPGSTNVLGGTYRVYEAAGSGSGRIDTKVDVTVDEDHTLGAAEINYYTLEISAGTGGTVTPGNHVNVRHGEDQTVIITPDRDHHIKQILIDGAAVSDADLADKDSYTYTFSGVKEGHRVEVVFETDSEIKDPEGADKPGTSDKPEENKPGTPDTPEEPNKPGTPDTPGTPNDTDKPGISDTTNTPDSNGNGTPQPPDSSAPGASAVATPPTASGGTSGTSSTSGQSREPKTGDNTPVEMYATLAMIAGLTEVMLYFARKNKGMTEDKKKELVASLVSWAKRGTGLRRYAALAAVFGVLLYYHSIGKCISGERETIYGV